jgi:arylsulfatase A
MYFPDMVSYMDMLVGKIVSKVDELGLSENTLIIFTGDNGTDQPVVSMFRGEKYPGGKKQTTDNGTHVPLIARWEGTIESEKESFDMVDFSDFLPTICDVANIEIPSNIPIDGISFLPQLLGKKGKPRKWIYSWY